MLIPVGDQVADDQPLSITLFAALELALGAWA
jgi:hypothetical protein